MGVEISNLSNEESLFLIKIYELGLRDNGGRSLHGLSNVLELEPTRCNKLITDLSEKEIIVIKDRALYFTEYGLYEFKKQYKSKIKRRSVCCKLKAIIIEGISKGIVKSIIAIVVLVFTFYSGLYFGSDNTTNTAIECTSDENAMKSPKA
ncbi:hypothetical protein HYO40_22480 [Vibrio parahaemolyticus]|nr:hypothetical protein [Vibrio parahaemolyticus]